MTGAEIARIIGGNADDKVHLDSAELLLSDAENHKKGVTI